LGKKSHSTIHLVQLVLPESRPKHVVGHVWLVRDRCPSVWYLATECDRAFWQFVTAHLVPSSMQLDVERSWDSVHPLGSLRLRIGVGQGDVFASERVIDTGLLGLSVSRFVPFLTNTARPLFL
jgi:hypothetical protein